MEFFLARHRVVEQSTDGVVVVVKNRPVKQKSTERQLLPLVVFAPRQGLKNSCFGVLCP